MGALLCSETFASRFLSLITVLVSMPPFRAAINPILKEIESFYSGADPAHDLSHAIRVCRLSTTISKIESANEQVIFFASLLHDVDEISCQKATSELKSSQITKMNDFLVGQGLDEDLRREINYAVSVHRYSYGIVPITLEAKILQDSDRLDALGATGIARLFLTGGSLGRMFYNLQDPFCKNRNPDDEKWNLDHFYKKLLKLESGFHTESGKKFARKRTAFIKEYLLQLETEIE